jgi:hypothetical protein
MSNINTSSTHQNTDIQSGNFSGNDDKGNLGAKRKSYITSRKKLSAAEHFKKR